MAIPLPVRNVPAHRYSSANPFSVFEREQHTTIDQWLREEAELVSVRLDDTGSGLAGPVEWIDGEIPLVWRKDI